MLEKKEKQIIKTTLIIIAFLLIITNYLGTYELLKRDYERTKNLCTEINATPYNNQNPNRIICKQGDFLITVGRPTGRILETKILKKVIIPTSYEITENGTLKYAEINNVDAGDPNQYHKLFVK